MRYFCQRDSPNGQVDPFSLEMTFAFRKVVGYLTILRETWYYLFVSITDRQLPIIVDSST